jgi:hypothetical protein
MLDAPSETMTVRASDSSKAPEFSVYHDQSSVGEANAWRAILLPIVGNLQLPLIQWNRPESTSFTA